MKSLEIFSAEVVISNLSFKEDIHKLDIPRELFSELETDYKDSWRPG